jgi:hypothetical protein
MLASTRENEEQLLVIKEEEDTGSFSLQYNFFLLALPCLESCVSSFVFSLRLRTDTHGVNVKRLFGVVRGVRGIGILLALAFLLVVPVTRSRSLKGR